MAVQDSTNLQTIPIVGQLFSYMNGLRVFASATDMAISAGQCRDSTNIADIVLSSLVNLNPASVNGANALDEGSLVANTWYKVYAIGASNNGKVPATLLSLASNAAPVMPFGYNIFRVIDYWLTDGSAQFVPMFSSGNNGIICKQYGTPIAFLSAGAAVTRTNINLSTVLPPATSSILSVEINCAYTPAVAANSYTISVPTAVGSNVLHGGVATFVSNTVMNLVPADVAGIPTMDYSVTASDTLSITCVSFTLVL